MLINPGLVVFGLLFMAFLNLLRVIPRGMPVLFLLVLPIMIVVEYVPAVQTALTTNTPLVLEGWLHESFAVDGLSLLFACVITSVAAITALYVVLTINDEGVYGRFIRGLLIITSGLLAFVMINNADVLVYLLAGMGVGMVWVIYFDGQAHLDSASGKRWQSWIVACVYVIPLLIMRVGISVLENSGTNAKQLTDTLVEINQLSTANLSSTNNYEIILGCVLAALVVSSLSSFFLWSRSKSTSALFQLFLPCLAFTTTLYPLVRFYPALHDNPLWWAVVTGTGLLMMLCGAVWAVWQTDHNRLLIGMTFSALGACLALLGLPGYLGVQAALMGIGVYCLVFAGLFLSGGLPRIPKTSVGPAILLAMLATSIIDVWTINAFYAVTRPWAGVALAVVVLNTALLTMSMIRLLRPSGLGQWWRDVSSAEMLGRGHWDSQRRQGGMSVGVVFIGLVFALTFDVLWSPLLPQLITQRPDMDISAGALCLLAWGGGAILYLTRAAWGGMRPLAQSSGLPMPIETQKS